MNTRQFAWLAGGVAAVAAGVLRRHRRVDFHGASVVITGGSRGLGLVVARQLAAEGARLTLVARDIDELERARIDLEGRGASVATAVCDVRNRAQVERAIAQIASERGGIDVLVNDAGIIQVGPFEHMTVEDFENAMATHFWGPLYATLAAIPHLRQSRVARIVNISSIGGKIAVPHLLPYSASKFALAGLSNGLHAELASDGICVTTVCPGLMRTGSTYNATFKGKHRQEFAWFHVAGSLPGLSMDAARAARQIVEAARRGRAELVLTLPAKAAVLMSVVCPETTQALLALTNRLLPAASLEGGTEVRSGWQSVSRVAPSFVTRSGDRATRENNEVPAGMQPSGA
jgi:NAD(P)-dependent dehydrogenase (short-subunit alcohol dehydrogenase family)